MSVIVARDQSTAGHIVYPWPEPVPWGATLICADSEVAVICPNWELGEQVGPGRHPVSPPNPQSYTLVYFISTVPKSVQFDRTIAVVDGKTGQPVGVRFFGSAQIKIADPLLICHQVVGLPYHDLTTGIMRSAELSICRTFQNMILRLCMAHATVLALASADSVSQIVNMAAGANPMTVAVAGLELVRFEKFGIAVAGREPIAWKAGPAPQQVGSANLGTHASSDLDELTQRTSEPNLQTGARPMVQAGQVPGLQTGAQPPASAQPALQQGFHASGPPGPQAMGTPPRPPPIPGSPARRKTPPLGSPIVPILQSGEAPLPAGSQVLVYWNDGLWHAATIRHFEGGRYQVSIKGSDTLAWVQASQIRPA